MVMSPVQVAFATQPAQPATAAGVVVCARCGQRGPGVPASAAVSRSFTGVDEWVRSGGDLCAACAWMYRSPVLRRQAHLVDQVTARLTQPGPVELQRLLTGGRLAGHLALVVPLRGRKHVFPRAQWGMVAVDDATLSWSSEDASLLVRYLWLRSAGAGVRQLLRPAPPYVLMRRLPEEQWKSVLEGWQLLRPVLQVPGWAGLAARVSGDLA